MSLNPPIIHRLAHPWTTLCRLVSSGLVGPHAMSLFHITHADSHVHAVLSILSILSIPLAACQCTTHSAHPQP
ncbi:hypothetical protein DM02DRAFT_612531 [Periconia macrospinosa]|uniref:Uncharacterized protein n=1 Tax=Periconia macrospinosa TaxID=97972 RepID=A0A2V1DX06_9PLEO|nr:hypothetical protein DM02DRAFT_612531 [Periconia macrospinosa]